MSTDALDLTGGLEPELDLPVLEPPADVPGFKENHSFWLFDDEGRYAVLCLHLQMIDGMPTVRRELGSITLPGERILLVEGDGPLTTADGPGASATTFTCVEPFARWRGRVHGTVRDLTHAEQVAGPVVDGPRALVELDFDAEMVAPPWIQGSLSQGEHSQAAESTTRFAGDRRYDQLLRATVRLRVDDEEHSFGATGVRTHRVGPRRRSGFAGFTWASAWFPSGRGFGLMRFRDESGAVGFREGFVLDGGRLVPAHVADAPWLESTRYAGERSRVELDSPLGPASIDVETLGVSYWTSSGPRDHSLLRSGLHPTGNLCSHTMARYTWDGEQAHGLLDRSTIRASVPGLG